MVEEMNNHNANNEVEAEADVANNSADLQDLQHTGDLLVKPSDNHSNDCEQEVEEDSSVLVNGHADTVQHNVGGSQHDKHADITEAGADANTQAGADALSACNDLKAAGNAYPPAADPQANDELHTQSDVDSHPEHIEEHHHSPISRESADIKTQDLNIQPKASRPYQQSQPNIYCFDCCSIPTAGGAQSSSTPSAPAAATKIKGKPVLQKAQNPNVSFDCCSVPLIPCESRDDDNPTEEETIVETAESSEATTINDDEPQVENEAQNIDGSNNPDDYFVEDTDLNGEAASSSVPTDSLPSVPGSEVSQDATESPETQHIPVDNTDSGSAIDDLLEKEESDRDTADQDVHVSGDMNEVTLPDETSGSHGDRDTPDQEVHVSGDMNEVTLPDEVSGSHGDRDTPDQEVRASGDMNEVTLPDETSGSHEDRDTPDQEVHVSGDMNEFTLRDETSGSHGDRDTPDQEVHVSGAMNEVTLPDEASGSHEDRDTPDQEVRVSGDRNDVTPPDDRQPYHENGTASESGQEDTAKNETTFPSEDQSAESMVAAASHDVDVSTNESLVPAPEIVEAAADLGVCVDNDDKLNGQDSEKIDEIHKDEAPSASPEIPVVAEVVKRPFYFLVRHPRFEDANLREQLQLAQLKVDEKTRERDAIRVEIQNMRSTCKGYNDEVEAAISKERGMRDLLKSKRQEMESLQSMINRVKNAISVEDIDGRICNMQHMIEHETLPLNEEKKFIREINQLKQLRAQLSTNLGKEDEVQQALDERDKIEERLKELKKEADSIRDRLSKFEGVRKTSKNKYVDENKKLGELQAKFRAANDVRQNAYANLQSLKKQMYEKNKHFRGYKDDIKAVDDLTSTGDREKLQHYCVNQVESFMDLWNTDAEFRKEYIRCNTRSTLRRLGTADGRSLGPEESPPVVPPVIMYNKAAKIKSVSQAISLEQEKKVTTVEAEKIEDKPATKVVEQKTQTAKSKNSKKSAPVKSSAAVPSKLEDEDVIEIDNKKSKEEEELDERQKELAKREEELRKEEEAARFRELRRLEEKAKSKEAMERKKRQAEKAQARAALRAQKEAEERERERERRAKKKEKKKTATVEATNGSAEVETPPSVEVEREASKQPDSVDKPNTVTKKPQRPSQFTKQTKSKSIPPPLRNRGKKRMQSWMWFLLIALLVVALFLLGNSNWSMPFRLESFGFF